MLFIKFAQGQSQQPINSIISYVWIVEIYDSDSQHTTAFTFLRTHLNKKRTLEMWNGERQQQQQKTCWQRTTYGCIANFSSYIIRLIVVSNWNSEMVRMCFHCILIILIKTQVIIIYIWIPPKASILWNQQGVYLWFLLMRIHANKSFNCVRVWDFSF